MGFNVLGNFFSRTKPKYYDRVKKVFFVLSTGRCGTKYVSNLLDLATNACVLHEPPPGGEAINPNAYELYLKDKDKFKAIRVKDFAKLQRHVEIYRTINADVFGDCYNSFYPFAIAFFNYFRKNGIEVKFIHLVREPVACSSSILRAEGPNGIGIRKDFGLRAKSLSNSTVSAEIAADIWIRINEVIMYETDYIESISPGSTKLVRLEDIKSMNNIPALYEWLGLAIPEMSGIEKVVRDGSYDVRHSHQVNLDKQGIPKNTPEDLEIIKERTEKFRHLYGY